MSTGRERLRLCRLMCGRSLTFRSSYLDYLGLRPRIRGRSPRET